MNNIIIILSTVMQNFPSLILIYYDVLMLNYSDFVSYNDNMKKTNYSFVNKCLLRQLCFRYSVCFIFLYLKWQTIFLSRSESFLLDYTLLISEAWKYIITFVGVMSHCFLVSAILFHVFIVKLYTVVKKLLNAV